MNLMRGLGFWTSAIINLLTFGQSPNPWAERRVSALQASRPQLSRDDWHERHWRAKGISKAISDHVYGHFSKYSGLEMGRVLPTDTLLGNLEFSEICWFDWDAEHWEDFKDEFKKDIIKAYPQVDVDTTIEAIMTYLNSAVK